MYMATLSTIYARGNDGTVWEHPRHHGVGTWKVSNLEWGIVMQIAKVWVRFQNTREPNRIPQCHLREKVRK